jgi:hypothetical protein
MLRCRTVAAILLLILPFAGACSPTPAAPPVPTASPAPTTAPMQPTTLPSGSTALHEQIDGAWGNELILMVFDFAGGHYETIAMLDAITGPLTLISEDADSIICQIGDQRTRIELLDPNTIRLTTDERTPLVLSRRQPNAPGGAYPYPAP